MSDSELTHGKDKHLLVTDITIDRMDNTLGCIKGKVAA